MAVGSPSVRAFFLPILFSLVSARCSLIKVNKPTSSGSTIPGKLRRTEHAFLATFYAAILFVGYDRPTFFPLLHCLFPSSSPFRRHVPRDLLSRSSYVNTYIHIYIYIPEGCA